MGARKGDARVRYDGSARARTMTAMKRKRVAVLISGRGSNMAALIEAAEDEGLSGRNRAGGVEPAGCRRARCLCGRRGSRRPLPSTTKLTEKTARPSSARFKRILEDSDIEIVCLRGFMRCCSPRFIDAWEGRMLNIHPALLPNFKGPPHPRARALEAGAKEHGATVHFVTASMDEGPTICQAAVPVLARWIRCKRSPRACRPPSTRSISLALKWLAEGKLQKAKGHAA